MLDTDMDANDPGLPAHATMRIRRLRGDSEMSTEDWLLAESWWADTFAPPTFGDLVNWSVRVFPWTVGSHYGARVRRAWRRRKVQAEEWNSRAAEQRWIQVLWERNRRYWSLGLAILSLVIAILSSAIIVPLLLLVPILALIPIPQVRGALQRMQLSLASSVGDSYVLLSRPVEAAAIVSQVRRDLDWLSRRCDEVAIVAHSQGAAVAHLACRGGVPKEVCLLFTFGSGLRKLELLRALMVRGGNLATSALVTAGAGIVWALWTGVIVSVLVTGETLASSSGAVAVGVWLVLSVIVALGVKDLLTRVELPDLHGWIERLGWLGVWKDCYATADPVPNGPVTAAAEEFSYEVCNQSSILRDHTSYWANRDEFVTLLCDTIWRSRLAIGPDDLQSEAAMLGRISERRRYRVLVGSVIRWMGVAALAAAVLRRPRAWQNLGTAVWEMVLSGLDRVLGLPEVSRTHFALDFRAIGWLALAGIFYLVVRAAWRSWNRQEVRAAVELAPQTADTPPKVILSLFFLYVVTTSLFYGHLPPIWLFATGLVGAVALGVAGTTRPGAVIAPHAVADSELADGAVPAQQLRELQELPSKLHDAANVVLALFAFAAGPFAVGLLGWKALAWLDQSTGGRLLPGPQPNPEYGFLVGLLVAAFFTIGLFAWTIWKSYRAPGKAGIVGDEIRSSSS